MQPGDIIAERVQPKKGDEWWRVYAVKSVTQTGAVTLLRSTEGSYSESKTTKGFAQAVDKNELDDWRKLNTSAIDILASNAIVAGGGVERESWRTQFAAELRSRVARMTGSSDVKHAEARTMLDIADELAPEVEA